MGKRKEKFVGEPGQSVTPVVGAPVAEARYNRYVKFVHGMVGIIKEVGIAPTVTSKKTYTVIQFTAEGQTHETFLYPGEYASVEHQAIDAERTKALNMRDEVQTTWMRHWEAASDAWMGCTSPYQQLEAESQLDVGKKGYDQAHSAYLELWETIYVR